MSKLNILISPGHFILSENRGSEYYAVNSIVSKVSKNNNITTVVGKHESGGGDAKVFEVWADYSSSELNLIDSLKFNMKYTYFTFKYLLNNRKNIDIVHHLRPFNLYQTFNFLIIFKLFGLPYIIGPFAAPYNDEKYNTFLLKILGNIAKFLNYLTLKNASAVLVNEKTTQAEIQNWIKNTDKIFIVPDGKDKNEFTFVEKDYNADVINIVTVGKLITRKAFDKSIRCIYELNKITDKKVILHIVGDGYLKPELEKLINELKLTNIILHGAVSYNQMKEFYNKSHYFLMTPEKESFAHVFIEAIASGLPTVALDTVGSRHIPGDCGGIIVPQNQPEQLAIELKKLIEDPELSATKSKQAREHFLNNFDWDTVIIPKVNTIYEKFSSKK